MTKTCKFPFQLSASRLQVFVFLSVFIHFCLFWQLGVFGLTSPPFPKLMGRKGGDRSAHEIAYFPQLGSRKQNPVYPKPPENLTVTEKATKDKLKFKDSETADSQAGTAKRGIGQGGTSVEYGAVLHAFLDSAKVFPRKLKDLGIAGVVKVRFQVTPEGRLENISVLNNQAPELIAAEALRFLSTIEGIPVPPSHLTQKELEFELPLRYELNS
jgi:TonB family protein